MERLTENENRFTPKDCEKGLFIRLSTGKWAILRNGKSLFEKSFDPGFLESALRMERLELKET